ncbi:MAG: sigma-54-dependent Fis family transcriptional regulator [Syntrophomonadaceae bacterium]|nr:sigma-54-dependent Fis family transcriptional regulator [Syntrophomonadaceae bacterium]
MFDKPNRKDMKKSWHDFQNNKSVGPDLIREVILDSWKRSQQFGVNALHQKKQLCSSADLKKRQANNIILLNAANGYLENLYFNVLNSQGIVVLSDADGIIIFALGDEKTMRETTAPELGNDCSEATLGTNGVGTCLALRSPIQIWAEEHYYQGNHIWYCSGAPIFDPAGNMLGCLNVTGTSESVHAHTLGMVLGIANAVERQIKINQITAENQRVIRKQEIMLDLIMDGVLIVDPAGKIVEVNQHARHLLGLVKNEIVDQPLAKIIPSGLDIEDIFMKQRMLKNMEIDFALQHKDLSCSVSTAIIRNEKGLAESLILTFTPTKNIHALVNQVTGSVARYTFEQMIGRSPVFQEAIRQGKLAALTSSNVLITGESGTGKELMAQAIHSASNRFHKPFIIINCGALPRGLIVSELFGYEEGSFTGSKKGGNPGKFELADGGTIFLDEIGELPLDSQATLLRIIQEKVVHRIGSNKPKPIDVRIIAATNRDLAEEVQNKNFRHDLFYRLNVLTIHMPSLRERHEDIEVLIDNTMNRIINQTHKINLTIDGQALAALQEYEWPGNIRELENILERAANICEDSVIRFSDLPHNITGEKVAAAPDMTIIEQTEKNLIMDTLRETGGNIKQTAEKLGIARNTIYRKMKRYNIASNFGENKSR